MKKLLSIIIPMYHSASFIEKCLDHLLLPPAWMEQLEVLVVSDGSTDRSEELVKPYTRKYPESILLYHKENGGHSSVINYAVPLCHGTYLKILDADDWFQTSELEKLMEQLAKMPPAQLILSPFCTFHIGTQVTETIGAVSRPHRITMSQLIKHWTSLKSICCFHGMIYRTDFYKMQGFSLPEKVFYDDAFYCTLPAYRAKQIVLLPDAVYVYRIGDCNQSVSIQNRVMRISQLETVIDQMLLAFQKISQPAGNEFFYKRTASTLADYLITVFLRFPDRREGRRLAKRMLLKIKAADLCLYQHIHKKYLLLLTASRLKLSEAAFMKCMHTFHSLLR